MGDLYENHLKYWTKTQPSDVGLRVAALLDEWQGLHHFDSRAMKKVDWSNPLYILLTLDHGMSSGQLATYDFSGLTALVFLAHDHCIRLDVQPCNGTHVKLVFHPRQRSGSMPQRHPGLEDAVTEWRKRHPRLPVIDNKEETP
jgi:hypothetical protein